MTAAQRQSLLPAAEGKTAAVSDLTEKERAEVLELVELARNHEDARPLTDHVSVVSAEIIKYSISAHITVYSGTSFSVVEDAANDAIKIYTNERHAMGELVAISGD